MSERKRSILLVGLDEGFVSEFGMNARVDEYRVGAVDNAMGAIKVLANSQVDVVVFRFDQASILWDAFADIVRAIHGTTRIVMLFNGSSDEELRVLNSTVDLCLPTSKSSDVCFEYIHRLFGADFKPVDSDYKLHSIGMNNFEVDLKTEVVTKNGEEITLTNLEYRILVALIQNSGKTLNRQEIFEIIYKNTDKPLPKNDRRIDMHVVKLRQKIGAPHIRSIRGRGYHWDSL